MANIEILALNGSPGTGKNTITRAISERLNASAIPHAVIGVDEIALVFDGRPFADFEVSTHGKSIEETVAEVVVKAGWRLPS